MDAIETISGVVAQRGRAAGTDAERMAATLLVRRLRAAGREARLETCWVRPDDDWALALHCAVAIAGSLLVGVSPVAATAVTGLALASLLLDLTGRGHLLRRLTLRRATQNIVSPAPERDDGRRPPLRLVIVARTDAGRGGLTRRDGILRLGARLRSLVGEYGPGGLGLLAWTFAVLVAVCAMRIALPADDWLGVVQLVPTLLILLAFAVFLDAAVGRISPGANDDASGIGVALALTAALDARPPRALAVELVLAGAGTGPSLGWIAHLRRHRNVYRPRDTIVLELAPCGRGRPRWWTHAGAVAPLALHPQLTAAAAEAAAGHGDLGARPHRGRDRNAAYAARVRGLPAIAVGCLEDPGFVPASRQQTDTAESVDPAALESTLTFCLALIEQIDRGLGS